MVRGCQKKIIHLRDTGSELFEEAYFILKNNSTTRNACESDMIREARRIVEENKLTAQGNGKREHVSHHRMSLRDFLAGALFAAAAAIVILAFCGVL